jgi:hypothetical protein
MRVESYFESEKASFIGAGAREARSTAAAGGGAQRPRRCARRRASSRRRACFVGRAPRSAPSGRASRRSSACCSRAVRDSGVSAYIVAAALAGPRRSATSVTATVRRTVPIVTSIVSPARTTFDGFTRSPLTCTRPPSTAAVPAPRVLKKRAAHSHLSIRTWSTTAMIAADDSRADEVVAVPKERL